MLGSAYKGRTKARTLIAKTSGALFSRILAVLERTCTGRAVRLYVRPKTSEKFNLNLNLFSSHVRTIKIQSSLFCTISINFSFLFIYPYSIFNRSLVDRPTRDVIYLTREFFFILF